MTAARRLVAASGHPMSLLMLLRLMVWVLLLLIAKTAAAAAATTAAVVVNGCRHGDSGGRDISNSWIQAGNLGTGLTFFTKVRPPAAAATAATSFPAIDAERRRGFVVIVVCGAGRWRRQWHEY